MQIYELLAIKQANVLPGVPRVPLASNSWKTVMPKVQNPFSSTVSANYKSPTTGHMGAFKGTGLTDSSAITKKAYDSGYADTLNIFGVG